MPAEAIDWLRRSQSVGFWRHSYIFQRGTCEGPEIGGPEVDDPGTSIASGATVGGVTPGRVIQEKHSGRAKWAELGQAGYARAGLAGRRPDWRSRPTSLCSRPRVRGSWPSSPTR